MENTQTNSSSVAIVAIIVVGLLIVGAGVLFYTGTLGGGSDSGSTNTTVIEAPAEKEGMSLKFEDKDGVKTEISTN